MPCMLEPWTTQLDGNGVVEREEGASQEVGVSRYWRPTMCQTPCPGVWLLCTTSLECRCPSATKSIHDKLDPPKK